MKKIGIILGTFLVALTATQARANLVLNGGFDTGTTGWSFASTAGATHRTTGGNPGGYAVLNANPGPVPSMSQLISGLVVGTEYVLEWDMISAFNCCASSTTPGVGAEIDGNLWQFIVPNSQSAWVHYTQSFIYSGGSANLTYSTQRNGTDTDGGFDNVSLNPRVSGTVPEPATLWLAGLALATLGAGRAARRRDRTSA